MKTKQANSAKKTIYRVAIVDVNFKVMSYLPDFYSTEDGAKEAIERAINSESMREWNKQDWKRHPWQTSEDSQCGTRCIEMVKTAEIKDCFGGYFYKGYGFIAYTLI